MASLTKKVVWVGPISYLKPIISYLHKYESLIVKLYAYKVFTFSFNKFKHELTKILLRAHVWESLYVFNLSQATYI